MKVAILGFDRQGRSALDYWGPGNEVTICDRNPDIQVPPNVATQLGENYLQDLERFKLVVRTPGLHPRDIVAANNEHILKKVTTVTEEFFRNCPAKIIGVTGTKGKGTTSTLIAELLKAAGKTVHLGGNIGIPPLDLLKNHIQPSDVVVLELANFQLIDLHVSPPIAVCLVVTSEHLDWHQDMEEYIAAKQNLFRYQDDDDLAIFNRLSDFSEAVVNISPALKVSYEVPAIEQSPQEKNGVYVAGDAIYYDDTPVCKTSDVALLGRHNLENVCAAIAATWDLIDGNTDTIVKVLHEFKSLPHRLQLVHEQNGIKYYDDSFAATPDAAVAAIAAVPGSKVMILGGYDRGLDLHVVTDAVIAHNKDVRQVLLIGQTAPKLASQLQVGGYKNFQVIDAKDMKTVVAVAKQAALPGDSVVLSPGSASFDMFKDFEDRGLQFTAEVQKT